VIWKYDTPVCTFAKFQERLDSLLSDRRLIERCKNFERRDEDMVFHLLTIRFTLVESF
jgi:hypothetical protein